MLRTLLESYGVLVNGAFVEPSNGQYQSIINPANGKKIVSVANAGNDDVDIAVTAAQTAFQGWAATTRGERARLLNRIADVLEKEQDYFARCETLNTGKCLSEATLQIGICIEQYRYFAAAILTLEDTVKPHENGGYSLVQREPLGVVALVLPFNAPSMLMSWKLAPALAAGNTVVIKPASNASIPVLEIARMCQEILPPGVVNVVPCSGQVGNHLISHPSVSKISFTGSSSVGAEIAATAARNVVPCTLELGGKSAFVLFDDADRKRALQYVGIGILSSAGQVCVGSSRLLVQETIYESFLEELAAMFSNVRVGDPLLADTQMGPVIDEKQLNNILRYVEIGVAEGATLRSGGNRLSGADYDGGFYLAPTILADVQTGARCAQEEIFGPVLVVMPFKDEQDAIRIANDSQYGLGAAVWTRDIYRAHRVSNALQAGTVWVNDYLYSPYGAPFGGYKKSGLGRELHKMTLDQYSAVKNICFGMSEEIPPVF